jgi:iron(III) transport system substrate-binding protein
MRSAVLLLCLLVASVTSALAADTDWKKQWDSAVAAANKEGSLVISGPSGRVWRDQLMEFEKAYPSIKLSITAVASRDFWPRVVKEREAGQHLWDLRIGGADAISYGLKAKGVLAPIRPLLLLPEVTDASKWMGGLDGMFLDNEKTYFLDFAATNTHSDYYNRKKIPDSENLTIKSLIDPKWSGKISMADPRGGSSLNTMTVIDKLFGDDFIVKLMTDQKPVIAKEPRQQIEWLASGRYPIAFGIPSAAMVEYAQHGTDMSDIAQIPGLNLWSPGVGAIQVVSNAPHPNATIVFVNWLLTRDVQAHIMPAVQLNSRRNDVPPGAPDLVLDPDHLSDYVGTQTEDMQVYANRVVDILRKTTP